MVPEHKLTWHCSVISVIKEAEKCASLECTAAKIIGKINQGTELVRVERHIHIVSNTAT